jgi:hypothetical protein
MLMEFETSRDKKIKFKTAKFLTGFKFVLVELAITTNKLCFFQLAYHALLQDGVIIK